MNKISRYLSLILVFVMLFSALEATLFSAVAETVINTDVLLSENKTATATIEQTKNGKAPASNAIDGDFATKWSTYGCDPVTSDAPAALQVDLGTSATVKKLGLSWYGGGRKFTYSVFVTEQSLINDTKVSTENNTPVLSGEGVGATTTASSCEYFTLERPATGRYVTVVVTAVSGATFAVLAELEVWGVEGEIATETKTPLLTGGTPVASYTQGSGYSAGNAIDDDITTRWSSYGGTLPAALMVDTNSTIKVDSIEVLTFQNSRSYSVEFYLSNTPTVEDGVIDLSSATKIASGTANGVGNGNTPPTSSSVYDIFSADSNISGRYFTVCFTAASSGSAAILWEIEAYGTEASVPVLAGGKAKASYEEKGKGAANAFDGDITSRWSTYGGTLPAALMIDTYKSVSVEQIDVLMFQTNRSYDMEFYLSDTPTVNEEGAIDITNAKKIATGTASGVGNGAEVPADDSATVTIKADPSITGRYFTVYCNSVSNSTTFALWEIAAFGMVHSEYSLSIINIERIAPIDVPYGTTSLSAYLPNEVEVLVEGNTLASTAVIWDTSDFDGTQIGSQVVTGSIVDSAANPSGFIPQVKVTVRSQAEDEANRQQFTINDGWFYYQGELANGYSSALATSDFISVSLPHTFNKYDGQDGGGETFIGTFYTGENWYRKTLVVDDRYTGKQVSLYFEGVSRKCEVYVNGTLAGSHAGSFTAFSIDITSLIKSGNNLIAVMVDNTNDGTTSPITGDFTVFGGIYRDVSVILTEPVYIGHNNNSDYGMKLTPSEISASSANLMVTADVVNATSSPKNVTAKLTLRNPSKGDINWIDEIPDEYLRFNKADMTPGGVVATKTLNFLVAANASYDLAHTFAISNPHLWNGLADPYRYIVDIELTVNGSIVDTVSDFVGIREFTVDRETGGYLNGNSYNLRGVSRHQDREDMGWALTEQEHNEDIAMIYMIGANAVRLAHYPQSDYIYELCDMYGLCVWAELSFVNKMGGSGTYTAPDDTMAAFIQNVQQELKDMIRQQYNHASIVVWSIENECSDTSSSMTQFMASLNQIVHQLDSTRLSTLATQNGASGNWTVDVIAWNLYPGWYSLTSEDIDSLTDRYYAGDPQRRPIGISEYGFGSNAKHHGEDETVVCSQSSTLQTQEYQCFGHENVYEDIERLDYLWCTFVWAMFDFSSDWRSEGGTAGTNTKGLVTRDHKTLKDAYYFYQATWSKVPMVHLNAKDYTQRELTAVDIKSYSNCDSVTLYVNDQAVSTLKQTDLEQYGVFKWEDVVLASGANTVRVVGQKDGKEYTDETVWNRIISDNVEIASDTVYYSFTESTIWMTHPMTVASVLSEVVSLQRADITVLDAEDNTIADANTVIEEGMILCITSESGKNVKKLIFKRPNIAVGKPVTVSSMEVKEGAKGEFLTDGDTSTRWTANLSGGVSFPESFVVDLKNVYNLEKINLLWFANSDRIYYFKVYSSVKKDGERQLLVDASKNNVSGTLKYDFENVRGRYIYVDVLGNNHYDIGKGSPAASCYEIQVYGWRMDSSIRSAVNGSEITLRNTEDTVSVADFANYLTIEGNCTYELKTKTEGVIASGDTLMITHNGKTETYTFVCEISDEPFTDPEADAVVALIGKLPEIITLADKSDIVAARAAYSDLTDSQKLLVTNLDVLENAEKALADLEKGLVSETYNYGDLNNDGLIDAVDALMVLKAAVDKLELTKEQAVAADVDGNDAIDAVDALYILKKAVNTIDAFPVETK